MSKFIENADGYSQWEMSLISIISHLAKFTYFDQGSSWCPAINQGILRTNRFKFVDLFLYIGEQSQTWALISSLEPLIHQWTPAWKVTLVKPFRHLRWHSSFSVYWNRLPHISCNYQTRMGFTPISSRSLAVTLSPPPPIPTIVNNHTIISPVSLPHYVTYMWLSMSALVHFTE